MAHGKHTCRILKDIRRQIAEANDIEFVTEECRFKGDCLGTCPRCEEEVRYLEQQLRARSLAGKAIALAGISAATLAMLAPSTSDAKVPPLTREFVKKTVHELVDTVTVKGVVVLTDSTGTVDNSEEFILASIYNTRQGKGASTTIDGEFCLQAVIGDTLEVSMLGYEKYSFTVTEEKKNLKIPLQAIPNFFYPRVITGIIMPPPRPSGDYTIYLYGENNESINPDKIKIYLLYTDEDGVDAEKYISPDYYYHEYDKIIIGWVDSPEWKDKEGNYLKEVTLSIEAEDYEVPVIVKLEFSKENSERDIHFRHKK